MAGANTLAEAIVTIRADDRQLNASLTLIRGRLNAFSATAVTLFGSAVRGASALTETMNKVNVVFGDSAWIVTEAAGKMADKFGIVKQDFLDMESTFGQLLTSMGQMTDEKAAAMSAKLSGMAADASSLWNVSFSHASEAIASALRGMSRPIAAFGIDTQLAAVKLEAFRMGLVKTDRDLTTQEKVLARASLIMKGLGVAQGDLAATSSQFANVNRAVWGRLTNAVTSFGTAIMPVVERFMGGLNTMMSGLDSWVDRNKSQFTAWAESAAEVFQYGKWIFGQLGESAQALGTRLTEEISHWTEMNTFVADSWTWLKGVAIDVFDGIGTVFRNWSLIGEYVGVKFLELMINIAEGFKYAQEVAVQFGEWFGSNFVNLITDGATAIVAIFSNMWQNVQDLFTAGWAFINGEGWNFKPTGLLDGFKAVTEALPEIARPAFTKLTADLQAITDKMGANEAKRLTDKIAAAQKPAALAAGVPQRRKPPGPLGEGDEGPDKGKRDKPETTDLKGFAKNLQDSMFGKNQANERTAKNTESMVSIMNRMEVEAKKRRPQQGAIAAGPG